MLIRMRCGCGKDITVAGSTSGTSVACACGRAISIPPLPDQPFLTGFGGAGRRQPKSAQFTGTRPGGWKKVGIQVAYALLCLLAIAFVILGGGIVVLGFVLAHGNRSGIRPTVPYAGTITATLGGSILAVGIGSLIRIREEARASIRTGAPSVPRRPSSATPPSRPGTVELPLTPEMHRCLRATYSRSWRAIGVGTACLFTYTLVLGYFFVNEDGPVGMRRTFLPLGMGTGMGGILLAASIAEQCLLQRDLRRSTFLRTTGPMKIWVLRRGFQLTISDRKFIITPQIATKLWGFRWGAAWGVVDHTKRSHRILEVRDASGRVAYRLPESQPRSRS
jgi:hypothetical protein